MSKHKCPHCDVFHDTTDWVVENEYWKCDECSQFSWYENWIAVKEEIDISKIEIGDEIQGTQGLWRTVMGMNYLSFDCGSHAVLKSHVIAHRPKDDTCPKCGGEADNGFDRQVPPNAYYCTKCESKEETPGAEPCTQCTNLKDVMGEGVFCPKHGYPPFTPKSDKVYWFRSSDEEGWVRRVFGHTENGLFHTMCGDIYTTISEHGPLAHSVKEKTRTPEQGEKNKVDIDKSENITIIHISQSNGDTITIQLAGRTDITCR